MRLDIKKKNVIVLIGFQTGTSHKLVSQTIIIDLDVNDYVGIWFQDGAGQIDSWFRNFTGYLIG
jgi:hypothetical protein